MQKSQGVLGRQDVRLSQEENENDTEEFGAIVLDLLSSFRGFTGAILNFLLCFVFHAFLLCFENSNFSITFEFKRSNYNVFSNFFKIFEKSSSYREEFGVGTEKKLDLSRCSSFRDFFASKGLVNSRDLEKSSTCRVVRVFECSSYRESTVCQIHVLRHSSNPILD